MGERDEIGSLLVSEGRLAVLKRPRRRIIHVLSFLPAQTPEPRLSSLLFLRSLNRGDSQNY